MVQLFPALQYGLVHISVGDLLRAEVAAGTPAGKKAKAFMDAGDLVPNEVRAGFDNSSIGLRLLARRLKKLVIARGSKCAWAAHA